MVTPVWADFVQGSLSNVLVLTTAGSLQSMQSSGLTALPQVVDGVQRAKITLDPFGTQGLPELVYVTSHAAGSNTATIQRIAGQPLRGHNASEQWVHAPTAEDFMEFQGQLDNQFHTSVFTGAGQVLGSTAAGVPSAVGLGTEYQALTVATAQASKLLYRAVPFICTSTTRPQQSNGQYVGMHIFETDTLHTLACTVMGNPGTWEYIDDAPGTVKVTGANAVDTGWVWCDGATYDGTQPAYTALWNRLGNQFGGTAQNNFKVPDLRGRFAQGWDPTAVGAATIPGARGYQAGASTAVLTVGNLPSHTHSIASHIHSIVHNHPNFSTSDGAGDHRHNLNDGNVVTSGLVMAYKSGGAQGKLDANPSIAYEGITFTKMDLNGGHNHSIDVPNFTGNSGGSGILATDATGTATPVSLLSPCVTLGYQIRL